MRMTVTKLPGKRQGKLNPRTIAHHPHIFILQVVAVTQKQAGVIPKRLDNLNLLAGHRQHRAFLAACRT